MRSFDRAHTFLFDLKSKELLDQAKVTKTSFEFAFDLCVIKSETQLELVPTLIQAPLPSTDYSLPLI